MKDGKFRWYVAKILKRGKSSGHAETEKKLVREVSCVVKRMPIMYEMEPDLRWQVISEYSNVLENLTPDMERESYLPFSKELIRQAICEELSENPDAELRSHLEVAFVRLESFLSEEDYEVIGEFKRASVIAQELAKSGDPKDIIASARIVRKARGDAAVRIQEEVSENMRKRLTQIRSVGRVMPLFPMKERLASHFELL